MVLRAGFHGTVGQPSAQVIDGSLKFERTSDTINTYLERTFTGGNSKKWTWSAWIKRDNIASTNRLFGGNNNSSDNANWFTILFHPTNNDLRIGAYSVFPRVSNESFRDVGGWYHLVVNVDIDNATSAYKYRAYINNTEVTWSSTSDQTDTGLNRSGFVGYIGAELSGVGGAENNGFGGRMTQCYFIDGQALTPDSFGFTDPLTNTWRPKKFSGDFNGYTLTAPTYNSGQGSDVTTSEFDKMVDGDLSTYGQGNGASGTNRFIGFSLAATAHPSINVKIKNTTGSALDFIVQPSVSGSGLVSQGIFASDGNNNGTVNVAANTTLEDTFSFPSGYEGFGRIYLNNSGNAADAWDLFNKETSKPICDYPYPELNKFRLPNHTNLQLGDSKIAQRVGSAVVSKYKPYAKSPVGIYNRIAKGIYA